MVELYSIDIPDEFISDEIRDGFLVTKKTKEIWAVELDLFAKFVKVCNKYNITYFADSGTLLGAARHSGFIPWDDDIDLAMLRKDYDLFCNVAAEEFTYPYFFQTEKTDPGSARKHLQIRNSMTTGILKTEIDFKYSFNQGIFIDIFPLDTLPPAIERNNFINEMTIARKKSNDFTDQYTHVGDFRHNFYYDEFEKIITQYKDYDGDMIGNLALMNGKRTSNRYKNDYCDTVELPFEFLTIKAPIGYKNELRRMFGIWKKYVISDSAHGNIIFDVDVPYTEYIK